MKQYYIFITIFCLFILSSCGTNRDQQVDTQNQITNENIEQQDITEETTKDTETNIIGNTKELVQHKDGNIYLYKDGKEFDYLTSKAFKCGVNDYECQEKKEEIEYSIIESKGNYGLVRKKLYGPTCVYYTFYGINLNTDAVLLDELYDSSHCFLGFEGSVSGNELTISTPNDAFIVTDENLVERGITYAGNIEDDGFQLEGNNWVKKISLDKKLPATDENILKIEELDEKYIHENLIKDGFKLNNLGNIKEYYKETITEESIEYGKGFTSWRTIYIQGNKVLDFEINNWGGQNLIIHNPTTNITEDLSGYHYPVQSIFSKGNGAKVIITDLDTIKLVDKTNGINESIWTR